MRRSTPLTWEELRVGAVLLVGLLLLALGIFFVGRTGNVFGERYRLVTLMSSAAGIVPGAAVQVAGQSVGQVDEVAWIPPEDRPEDGSSVALWLSVDRDVQPQIRSDSRALLRTQGLLGDRVVDIDPGTASGRVLEAGDTLPSAPSLDYRQMLEQASGTMRGLTEVTEELQAITGGILSGEGSLGRLVTDESLYRDLGELSRGLSRFLERVNRGDGSLGRLLTDDTLYRRLSSLAGRLDTVTRRISAGEGSLGRLVASDSLYGEVLTATERANALLRRVERGEGTAGRLVTDQALYEELLRTLVDLNALVEAIRSDPELYLPRISVF